MQGQKVQETHERMAEKERGLLRKIKKEGKKMKIIIKDKARFAILLVLFAEIALFITGLLVGWIEPNPQRFALISLVAVVSIATAMSAIGIERKTPEDREDSNDA